MTVPAHPPEEKKMETFHLPFSANLFANHDKSDAVGFTSTATDGTQNDFKLPPTGFKERHLEQFVQGATLRFFKVLQAF